MKLKNQIKRRNKLQIYKNAGITEARPFPHHAIKGEWLLPAIISDGEITLFLGHNYSKTLVIKNNKELPKIDTKEGNWDLLTQLTILKANDEDRCPPDEFIQNEIYLCYFYMTALKSRLCVDN